MSEAPIPSDVPVPDPSVVSEFDKSDVTKAMNLILHAFRVNNTDPNVAINATINLAFTLLLHAGVPLKNVDALSRYTVEQCGDYILTKRYADEPDACEPTP